VFEFGKEFSRKVLQHVWENDKPRFEDGPSGSPDSECRYIVLQWQRNKYTVRTRRFCVRFCCRQVVVSSNVTTIDWDSANKANFKLAEKEKGLAEQLRNEAWRAVRSTDRVARTRQAANTRRLGLHAYTSSSSSSSSSIIIRISSFPFTREVITCATLSQW